VVHNVEYILAFSSASLIVMNSRRIDNRVVEVWQVDGHDASKAWLQRRESLSKSERWPCLVQDIPYGEGELKPSTLASHLEEGTYFHQTLELRERRRGSTLPAGPGWVIGRWISAHPNGGSRASFEAALAAPRELLILADLDLEELDDHDDEAWQVLSAPPLGELQSVIATEAEAGLYLAELPTPRGWEAPAFFDFGGWNSCPPPAQHVGRLHQWHDRFGAEVVAILRDQIELRINRPPVDRDTCLRLAYEQYEYCPDLLDQGAGHGLYDASLAELGRLLWGRRQWVFWWD
jgi:hypothetical protein